MRRRPALLLVLAALVGAACARPRETPPPAAPKPLYRDPVFDGAADPVVVWYNDERDRKSIHVADSRDLVTWSDRGKAVGDQQGEGPKAFRWHDAYRLITDVWDGLAVHRSDDALRWTRQPGNLLAQPGHGADDAVKGGHPDVVVSGDRAWLFFFTHPGRRGADERRDGPEQRRSSIQVVELGHEDGRLTADRDRPTHVRLLTGRWSPARCRR